MNISVTSFQPIINELLALRPKKKKNVFNLNQHQNKKSNHLINLKDFDPSVLKLLSLHFWSVRKKIPKEQILFIERKITV